MVLLNSTLSTRNIAYPGQQVIFTCVTRNTDILEWRSDEHIGRDGDSLQLLSIDSAGTVKSNTRNPSTFAVLVSVSVDNRVRVIVSELHIRVSSQFPVSSVTCGDSGLRTNSTIPFHISGKHLILSGLKLIFVRPASSPRSASPVCFKYLINIHAKFMLRRRRGRAWAALIMCGH